MRGNGGNLHVLYNEEQNRSEHERLTTVRKFGLSDAGCPEVLHEEDAVLLAYLIRYRRPCAMLSGVISDCERSRTRSRSQGEASAVNLG